MICCNLLTAFFQRFVRIVTTIIIYITFPALWDAASVAALKLSRATGPGGAVCRVLIGLIATVVLTITLPRLRDAALVCTLPLV